MLFTEMENLFVLWNESGSKSNGFREYIINFQVL